MSHTEDLNEVHRTAFELEDVKFTFAHDIKVDVAGVSIDAKQGDMRNLSRYVAIILEDAKHGQIQDTDMVVELKQSIVKENVQGEFELATLEDYFYIKLKSYMKRLPESDRDKVASMLNSLVRKRHGKLVRLADSSKLTAELAKKMTVEEREFYNNLHNISQEFTKQIMGDIK